MSSTTKINDDDSVVHTKNESIQVDMRESLTTPHSNPSNPFAFTPDQLAALQDPKNIDLLHTYGGLDGVAQGLHADVHHGLTPNTTADKHITLNDITLDASKLTSASTVMSTDTDQDHASAPPNKTQLKKAATSHSIIPSQFAQRYSIFGKNALPPVKGKSIFQLMWMAFNDKTLILLAVAAVVSLAVGLYEDIAVPEYDAQGNRIAGVKWVEGVAIIVAILIVVMVGSVNDFQKEKQFRKLNAKKDDRVVKVKYTVNAYIKRYLFSSLP